jgi:hypothetical protein
MESIVGDIVARLKLDLSDWQRGIQQATQQGQQFQQNFTRLGSALSQTATAFTQTGVAAQKMGAEISRAASGAATSMRA